MKTTLDIPDELMKRSMRAIGAKTKRETVLRALEEMTRRAMLGELADRLGRSETYMTPGELDHLRMAETASLK
jgi:Arc/MetJ family transcription regulator